MIATILHSSPHFAAIEYNMRKVSSGDAEIIELSNLPVSQTIGINSNNLIKEFIEYSKKNDRIKNTQLHVAFSARGKEMSIDEIVEFAKKWMSEMGYGDKKQPYILFAHSDTDNNHVHLITSRVNPAGRKINHNFEKVRSITTVDKLLGVNTDQDLNDALQESWRFKYGGKGFGAWMAKMENKGYSIKLNDDDFDIIRNGHKIASIKKEEIEEKCQRIIKDEEYKKRITVLRAHIKKYQTYAVNHNHLRDLLHTKFGYDIVYIGNKDNPRGYFFIDRARKMIIPGSEILKIKELTFEPAEEKLKRIDALIEDQIKLGADSHLLAYELKKHFCATLKAGKIQFAGQEIEIKDYMRHALKEKDKEVWASKFEVHNSTEADIINKLYHTNYSFNYSQGKTKINNCVINNIKELAKQCNTPIEAYNLFKNFNLKIVIVYNDIYIINTVNRHIIKAADYNIQFNFKKSHKEEKTKGKKNHLKNTNELSQNSVNAINREWEIESNNYENDINLKR